MNVEDAKREKAGECICDVGGRVEDGQSTCKFSTAIEGCLVVDDERKERALCHAQEPSQSHQTPKAMGRDSEEGHGAEHKHHDRQHTTWTVLLAYHTEEGCRENVWDEEDREDEVVLITFQMKVILKSSSLRIT